MDEKLNSADQKKVNNCEFYLYSKKIMENFEKYKNIEVGEVYYIKWINRDGEAQYLTTNYGGDTKKKYMVFHKDGGFIFAKLILSNGKLGKEVTCFTTQFHHDEYILEADPEYVDSLILDDGKNYDPIKTAKDLTSKKNKARRKNKKIEITFPTPQLAMNYLKSLKVGDKLYDASTAFGSGIIEWEVSSMEEIPIDQRFPRVYDYTSSHKDHYDCGFGNIYAVTINMKGNPPKSRRWINQRSILTFGDFLGKANIYRNHAVFYKTPPFTVDDV